MTVQELIKELAKARDWDVEVGIRFEDGWTSIKEVEIDPYTSKTILIETEDEIYDRQYFEECPECKVLFAHLDSCQKA